MNSTLEDAHKLRTAFLADTLTWAARFSRSDKDEICLANKLYVTKEEIDDEMDSLWFRNACISNNLQPGSVKKWAKANKGTLNIFERLFDIEDSEIHEYDRGGRDRACKKLDNATEIMYITK